MKNFLIVFGLTLAMLMPTHLWAQPHIPDSLQRKHFVSTSLFMAMTLVPSKDNPRFFQLNYGYRFTPKDALILEAITWQYAAPIGIPYGPDKGKEEEFFPGKARDIGLGLAYQRFWWKGAYTTLHATPFYQTYLNPDLEKIQAGFQLFMTLRFGYHFSLLKHRLFIEPSVAFTHWPINTNLPEDFARQENKWPNYFLFEPGIHIGWKF